MQKIIPLVLALCCSFVLCAQPEKEWLQNIPASFSYKKELKNCVFVPGGTMLTGVFEGSDSLNRSEPKEYTFSSFHIWKHETSNQEYRAFVHWVIDSVCRERLGFFSVVNGQKQLNRKPEIDLNNELLEPLMISPENRIFNQRRLDISRFFYAFPNGDSVAVYPDSTAWVRDKPFRYCEPMSTRYFGHPAFNKYPVTCVSYVQALAYCAWKTKQWNDALTEAGNHTHEFVFRLPTAMEWEVAATDVPAKKTLKGISYSFPVKNKEGTAYLYNFGQVYDQNGFLIKDYSSMNIFYTEPVLQGTESKRGLYHMHGNVAEWTASKYHFSGTEKAGESAVNTTRGPGLMQIVKGGSWASAPFYLQPAVNGYYSPVAQHGTIGFRLAAELRLKPALNAELVGFQPDK